MKRTTREYTNKLLALVEEGVIDPMLALRSALVYMSEDDVKDMCHCNGLVEDTDEEDEG